MMQFEKTLNIWGYGDNWFNEIHYFFKPSDIELKVKEYIPNDKDIYFIHPKCSIPRFKLKQYSDKNGSRITRNIKNATAIFIPKSFKDSCAKMTRSSYLFKKEEVISELKLYNKCNNISSVINIIDKIENDPEIKLICFSYQIFSKIKNLVNESIINESNMDYYYYFDEEDFDKQSVIFSNSNIYYESDLIKLINDNGVKMDNSMYEQLSKMFESDDKDDLKVAIEIISNLDYSSSAVHILLLIKNYGGKIWDSGFRNHVNFMALRKFFNLNERYTFIRVNLDDIVNKLKALNLLTEENLAILLPLAENEIKESCRFDYFKVKEIEFKNDTSENNEDDEEIINIEDDNISF